MVVLRLSCKRPVTALKYPVYVLLLPCIHPTTILQVSCDCHAQVYATSLAHVRSKDAQKRSLLNLILRSYCAVAAEYVQPTFFRFKSIWVFIGSKDAVFCASFEFDSVNLL